MLPQQTGIQVLGYNFGFTAKNGNGWDDGRVDQLTALVRFWDTTGGRGTTNLLYGQSYNLNYKFNWTTFNFSETFTNPLDATRIGQVQYGFLGRDNNGWAGPYGPEINNISFQLRYKVDPCASNQLYSPSCPGYADAMSKLVPQQTTTATIATAVSEPTATTTVTQDPVVAATQPTQQTAQTTAQVTSAPQQTASTTPVTTQQATQQSSGSSPNLQLALNLISRNQERDRQQQQQAVQLALDATQQAVDKTLSIAQQTAQQAVQQSQTTETASIVQAVAQQQNLQQTFAQQQQQTVQQLQRNQTAAVTSEQQQAQFSSLAQQQQFVGNTQTVQQTNVVQQSSLQLQAPQQPITTNIARTIEQPIQQVTAITTAPQAAPQYQLVQPPLQRPQQLEVAQAASVAIETAKPVAVVQTIYREQELPQQSVQTLLDRSNPISELMLGQIPQQGGGTQQAASDLRRTGQTNELAGGVSLDSLATQPQGYSQYLTLAIADARFYQTREIYGRQTTVDNQRALRQLSSDRLHQEMVNQQYRK